MKKVDIEEFGIYRQGLTGAEIQEYLKKRAGVKEIGNLYKQFGKIAGANTGMVVLDEFENRIYLMYRHDVERFAGVLFENKETYFD